MEKGDLNEDGVVELLDRKLMSDYFFGRKVTYNLKNADFDDDGNVDVADLSDMDQKLGRIEAAKNVLKGDANSDGKVDEADIEHMKKYMRGKTSSINMSAVDADANGKITATDLSKLVKLVNEIRNQQQSTGISGDINNDGTVDKNDSELLKKYLVDLVSKNDIYNADLNGDDTVDIGDLSKLTDIIEQLNPRQEATGILGDINNDGTIDMSDIAKLRMYLNNMIEEDEIYNADVDNNGSINEDDFEKVVNLRMTGKLNKSTGIKGDINNDGKINADDQALMNEYLDGKVSYANVNNEDVNGDGTVDRNDARNLSNLIQYGKMEKPTDINGDINNDGRVDSADIDKLKDMFEGRESHINIYNANVNGDDVVDQRDMDALENLINYGTITKPEPPPPSPPSEPQPYQQWCSVAIARVDVYEDPELTSHLGNEKVFTGDPLDVLDENDNAYLVRYGVGTYPNYSSYKERWIEKWAIDEANKPVSLLANPTPPYQPWQAVISKSVPAYQDSGLSIRYGNEEVWVGDPVDVLNETDSAYYVRYGVGTYPNYSEYKERWISKGAISSSSPVNPTPTDGYQPWQATVQTKMPAYYDAALTDRRNNEEVWVGDIVTILDENDRAYKMRYWSNVADDYKERWVDKAALDASVVVNPDPVPGYQPWQATVQTSMPAYYDENLTDRRNNEEVWAGDNVTILDENDRAYKMRYWSDVAQEFKERWVDKVALSGTVSYGNPVDKSGWTAYAHYKKQVFTDPNLTETSGYEYVDAKEKVTIVDESDRSYLVRYWSTAIKDFKERWIDKASLTEPVPPSASDSSEVRQKLEQLRSDTVGFRDGDVYKGSGQCRGFANQVYFQLFGLKGISGYSNYNYAASSYPDSYVAGQLYDFGSNDTGAVQQLFSNVQPGAMVQMGRRGRLNSTGDAARPHTAVVYSVNSNGVEFYEANVSGNNVVNVKFYSWADLAKKNQGFTVYMPENYPTEETKPATPVLPKFVQPAPVTPPISPSVDYQPWQAIVKTNMPAYYDEGLTDRRNNEEVWAGDNVIILDENDRAYKMRYLSNKSNTYKERWVDKAALSEAEQPSSSDRIVPNSNLIPDNPIITPVKPHTGTTTTIPLTERLVGSGRVFNLIPGYRNPSYSANGGGLFIYNMNVNENIDSKTAISFDLYNTQNAAGFIEYYDEEGNLIGVDRVEPHSHVITDAEKWFSEAGKLLDSTLWHGLESPVTDAYNSTRTKINAPKGTHSIVVTNNSTNSMYAQVSNIVDKWFELSDIISSIRDVVSSYKDFKNDTININQILVVPTKKKISEYIMDNLIKSGVKSTLKEVMLGSIPAVEKFAQEGIQNRLKNIVGGIDISKTIADTIAENGAKLGIEVVKSSVYEVTKIAIGSNPGILGYEAINLVGKGLDSLDKSLTEEKLKKVKPMIFQVA